MSDAVTPSRNQRQPLRLVLPKLLLTSAIFWIPMLLFLFLANHIRGNNPLPGDIGILRAIHHISSPFMDKVAVAVTTLGSAPVVILAIVVAAALLAYYKRRRAAVFLLFCGAGTSVINIVFKQTFHRVRPDLWPRIVTETDYSFPSGHAMISSALAYAVIILCWKTRYRWWAVAGGTAFFVLVGLSRLYLGVHYPSDVVGGWFVSLLWVVTVHYVFGRYGKRRARIATETPPTSATQN